MIKLPSALIAKILLVIFPLISPQIKEWIKEQLELLAEKAKQTANPIDDLLVEFLRSILTL